MDEETGAAIAAVTSRLDDTELRCKILGYALRGAVEYMNPTSQTAAFRMARTAVLAYCPEGERGRRLKILAELLPNIPDDGGKSEFIPGKP